MKILLTLLMAFPEPLSILQLRWINKNKIKKKLNKASTRSRKSELNSTTTKSGSNLICFSMGKKIKQGRQNRKKVKTIPESN
jgi:hypothetical protein